MAIVNYDAKQTDEHCTFLDPCSLRNISCRYISHLRRQPISETYHTNLDTTVHALQNSELDASAVVYMNENFTDAFVAKMALGDDADAETVDSGQLHVWLNKAEQTDTIKRLLETAFDHFTKDIMTACEFVQDQSRFSFSNSFHYHYV
ncbi:uncharacterized protein LOC123877748 isoform X2 [Maniola jurtina]|uniref:uncharacterized protein LOC123877748 isoform X2 n=1 Tax=Maniola jurtina TaxID=191418 RepID=UPI001E68E658|nr:uncharacterized protein LOC123877748 isoform X2 [Maniola jurtina]